MERSKCSAQRLSLFIDGQCSKAQQAAIRRHLGVCKHCQDEAVLLSAARMAVKSFAKISLPPTMDKAFLEKFYLTKAKE